MQRWRDATNRLLDRPLVAPLAGLAVLAGLLALVEPPLALLVAIPAIGLWVAHRRSGSGRPGLQVDQLGRLHDGGGSRSPRPRSPQAAAHELAEHAMSLLGAPSAIVLIEGIGDTVRVTAGDRRRCTATARACASSTTTGRPRVDRRQRARRRQALLRARRAHPRRARAARVLDAAPALAVRRGAAGAAHDRRRARLVVRRHLLGEPRRRRPVVEPRDGAHHRRRGADDASAKPAHQVFRPVDEEGRPRFGSSDPGRTRTPRQPARAHRGRRTARSGGSRAAGRRCRRAATSSSRATTPSARRSRTTRTGGSRRSATSCGRRSRRSRASCTRSSAATPSSRPTIAPRIYEVMLREEQRLEDLVTSLLQATSLDRAGAGRSSPTVVDWSSVVTHQVDLFLRQDPTRSVELVGGAGGRRDRGRRAPRRAACCPTCCRTP